MSTRNKYAVLQVSWFQMLWFGIMLEVTMWWTRSVLVEAWNCGISKAAHHMARSAPLSFGLSVRSRFRGQPCFLSSEWKEGDLYQDSNRWSTSADEQNPASQAEWQDVLTRREDGSFWSSFESAKDDQISLSAAADKEINEDTEVEAWLDTLTSLSAEEVEFNLKEADRADKARQMEEWGFSREAIANTLDVAIDARLEVAEELEGMQKFREQSYWDDVDLATVESHALVERDEETGETIRSQMVYVDEHTCIGCTNCATTAQSTFFMHPEHGRARVYQQWGDDDETIQIAIETCPVDCIHYIPYEELVALEIDRRTQNINPKARLVSQAEFRYGLSHTIGGPNRYTAPQDISGNKLIRCSNCPSRGCATCPMYGVGENPEFKRKETARKARIAKRRLQEQRESEKKTANL